MSRIRSVGPVTKADSPFGVAGTMAAFATMLPCREFKVETNGCCASAGQRVRYPSGPAGTTVAFSENALASAGIPQVDDSGNVLGTFADSAGPPSGPAAFLVSSARQGWVGKNASPSAPLAGAK